MSSTVIRVPRITGFPIIIAGLISIRSVVIAIPVTIIAPPPESHNRRSFTPSGFREGPLPRGKHLVRPLASKSGFYERAKRRMAHPFKKQTRKGGAPSVGKLRVLHPPAREAALPFRRRPWQSADSVYENH